MRRRLLAGVLGLALGFVAGVGLSAYLSRADPAGAGAWPRHLLAGLILGGIAGLLGVCFGLPTSVGSPDDPLLPQEWQDEAEK
jgi:hypothetical protein